MGGVDTDISADADPPRAAEAPAQNGNVAKPPSTSEHLFRLLVEGVKDYSIFMLDPQGRVVTWNPGAERIKGYCRDEILGQHLSRFYPPEDTAKADRALRSTESEGRFEEEGWRLRKDGTRFWAHVVLTAIRDEAGQLLGFAKVTRDLTEQRKAEAERIRLAQSQESIRLRDEFLAVAGHEFKTPLQNLKLQLELLGRALARTPEEVNARMAPKMEGLKRQVFRLETLNTRLLDLSALRAGQLPLRQEAVELGPAVRSQVEALAADLRLAHCEVRVNEEPGLSALVDRSMLAVVLQALLSNALKFGEGRPIEISTSEDDELVTVAVVDHGIGISPADIERIFGKFERAVSPENYGGWGLGLYIARQLIERMGGSIEVASSPGHGSRFLVKLKHAQPAENAGSQ